ALAYRYGDMGYFDLQDFVIVLFQADTVDLRHLVPVLQSHHHIEHLLEPDAPHAVDAGDVDDAQPPDLHVKTGKVRRRADEFPPLQGANFGHVVGDQAMAPLHQGEHALALADAAGAAHQHADAENVDHAAVLAGGRGEIELQTNRRHVHEAHGRQGRFENRDVLLLRLLQHHARRVDVAGKNQARNAVLEEFAQTLAAEGLRQRFQILGLTAADDLHALECERTVEA